MCEHAGNIPHRVIGCYLLRYIRHALNRRVLQCEGTRPT